MRTWAVVAVLVSGCATPRINLERIVAEAGRNEVAASHLAEKKLVELEGQIDDLTFLREEQLVTSGRNSGRAAYGAINGQSSARTRSIVVERPYALLTTQEETWVTCFLSSDASADALSKGAWASMVGSFNSFERIDGRLRVVLTNCRAVSVSDRQPTPR